MLKHVVLENEPFVTSQRYLAGCAFNNVAVETANRKIHLMETRQFLISQKGFYTRLRWYYRQFWKMAHFAELHFFPHFQVTWRAQRITWCRRVCLDEGERSYFYLFLSIKREKGSCTLRPLSGNEGALPLEAVASSAPEMSDERECGCCHGNKPDKVWNVHASWTDLTREAESCFLLRGIARCICVLSTCFWANV